MESIRPGFFMAQLIFQENPVSQVDHQNNSPLELLIVNPYQNNVFFSEKTIQ